MRAFSKVEDAAHAGVRPQHYLNSGLFITERERAAMLDGGQRRKEGTLNAALDRLEIAVK